MRRGELGKEEGREGHLQPVLGHGGKQMCRTVSPGSMPSAL